LCLSFVIGCVTSHKVPDDPDRTELLKSAIVETEDATQNIETEQKNTEDNKGIAYYLYVGTGAVFYTGLYIQNEIVSGH